MKIACVQSNVAYADPPANALAANQKLRDLKEQGVDLALFPEAYLTGYCVDSEAEAKRIAIPISRGGQGELVDPPEPIRSIRDTCADLHIHAVIGLATRGEARLRNSAILFEPSGRMRIYDKTHLPCLGFDRFASPGDSLPVFETSLGKLGILICYDMRPPEPARVLALEGAELILLPTNWPQGAEVSMRHVGTVRAAESKVFVATCNRVGSEGGFTFIGGSKIINPSGQVLADAGDDERDILADLDLSRARAKRTINVPGTYELDIIGCRRPELYSRLVR